MCCRLEMCRSKEIGLRIRYLCGPTQCTHTCLIVCVWRGRERERERERDANDRAETWTRTRTRIQTRTRTRTEMQESGQSLILETSGDDMPSFLSQVPRPCPRALALSLPASLHHIPARDSRASALFALSCAPRHHTIVRFCSGGRSVVPHGTTRLCVPMSATCIRCMYK